MGSGLHEDVDLANFTQRPTSFRLDLELDADFADLVETHGDRVQQGRLTREWRASAGELSFDYRVERAFDHQGGRGTASLHRGVVVRVRRSDSPPAFEEGRLSFAVQLPPHGSWHACLEFAPVLEDQRLEPTYGCRSFLGGDTEHDRRRQIYLDESTSFEVPGAQTLAAVVVGALEQARMDLMSLRLDDLDTDERGWTVAAGLPVFVALFGRDTLTASWQSALASTAIMRGTLPVLARLQGTAGRRLAGRAAGQDAARGAHRAPRHPQRQPVGPLLRVDHHLGLLSRGPLGAVALDGRRSGGPALRGARPARPCAGSTSTRCGPTASTTT